MGKAAAAATRRKLQQRAPGTPIEPVIITTDDGEGDGERIPLFTIDGVEYTMPAVAPASLSLQVLDRIRRQGEEAAISWALEECVGAEGYQALLECKTLKPSQLKAIMSIIEGHILGQMEELSGN